MCGQCQKAKLNCEGIVEDGSFIFLSENEFAGGSRKRRRGPNVTAATPTATATTTTTTPTTTPPDPAALQDLSVILSPHRNKAIAASAPHVFPSILDIPIDVQALTYYAHAHVDVPDGVPEIMQGHVQYTLAEWALSPPDSILGLSVSAVSHATFGRARKSSAALAMASSMYSKALVKTNAALRDAVQITDDAVLLSALLLSFYENSVMERSSPTSWNIEAMASRSFAHHDGAMALLKLRRQRASPTSKSMELDKLTRRQLMRTLVLRKMPLPLWLRDGSRYGEKGFALELDRYMVIVAKLRHQASRMQLGRSGCTMVLDHQRREELQALQAEAQALDYALASWAAKLPADMHYSSFAVCADPNEDAYDRSYNGTIHIYPTVGHAGLWNRYRALRMAVNLIILQVLATLPPSSDLDSSILHETVRLNILGLAEHVCESVPFTLGTIRTYQVDGHDQFYVTKAAISPKEGIKASTAYYICWPLALISTICAVPEEPRQYLRDTLLAVSEIVDDGVLERLATAAANHILV